jgi:hypothetical protein
MSDAPKVTSNFGEESECRGQAVFAMQALFGNRLEDGRFRNPVRDRQKK